MDSVTSVGHRQYMDNETSQCRSDCFRVSLIIRMIMEHFSNIELLQLSLVNKQWNFEARNLLMIRGALTARIRSYCPCKLLAAFASDLRQIPVVPFSGISLDMMSHVDCCTSLLSSNGSKLDPSCSIVLDRLPWKHLAVEIQGNLNKCKSCPALVLVKKVLADSCGVLQEMSLSLDQQLEFFQEYLQGGNFLVLKTLKIGRVITYDDHSESFMKALLPCAPNLQELHLNGPINFKENILEGHSSAVQLVLSSRFNPLYEPACEEIINALRLKAIEICGHNEEFNVELLNRIIPMMLQASHTSLITFRMDPLFAVPLMCYGICMENVTELEINMDRYQLEGLQPQLLTLLKSLDFTRVFPKLSHVRILSRSSVTISQHDISAFVEQGNAMLSKALPDRAINIKHLTTTTGFCRLSTVSFLVQMFPYLKTLSLETHNPDEFPFTLIWEHFVVLEELSVTMYELNLG